MRPLLSAMATIVLGLLAEGDDQSQTCDNVNFCIGAAKMEITPPPGFPTGGHGPAGAIARGSWSRLWARAFFFKQPGGPAVVLVSCDLFAVPLRLNAKVWDQI